MGGCTHAGIIQELLTALQSAEARNRVLVEGVKAAADSLALIASLHGSAYADGVRRSLEATLAQSQEKGQGTSVADIAARGTSASRSEAHNHSGKEE